MIYNEDLPEEEPSAEESKESVFQADEEDPPLIGLVGDINEEGLQQIVLALLTFNGGRVLQPDKSIFAEGDDIEFFISSGGGSVNDMFAVYDLMQLIKDNRDIATFGYGKVSSAAVLLLAAGTKGKRHVGAHTRLMLHHCSTNASGTQPDLRANFDELKKVEEMMVEVLAANSQLSVGDIYEIISRNTDKYFSAEEALEMGIVDKII